MDVIAVIPAGKIRILSLEGVAASPSHNMRPESGYQWEIMEAWCAHDDVVNRTLQWRWYDGTDQVSKAPTAAVAAGVHHHYALADGINTILTPLVATNRVYPQVYCAVGAGKKIYIYGIVREYPE